MRLRMIFVVLLIACTGSPTDAELVGNYVIQYSYGQETLSLKGGGSYEQVFVSKEGKVLRNSFGSSRGARATDRYRSQSGSQRTIRKATMITNGHPPSMWVLRDDGVRLVREGVTTPEEVLRVTRA